jgi:hypothetical protein
MKCIYKFKIDTDSYISNSFPIKTKNYTCFFENDDNKKITTHLNVQINDYKDDLPEVQKKNNVTEFNFSSVEHKNIKNELIILQGVFSLWGIDKIYYEEKDIDWIPENDEEKKALPFTGVKIGKNKKITEVPFDLFAHSILCLEEIENYSMQLNFFRRGKIELHQEQYRESFIYFYLIIESLYGNGKYGEKQLKKEFGRSTELSKITEKILKKQKIDKSINDYYSYIINKRGFLLHHSTKRSNIWHPENQIDLKNDAYTISFICLEILIDKKNIYLFSDKTKNELKIQKESNV